MYITSTAITDGTIPDRFGKKGTQFTPGGMPSRSIPFSIREPPVGTAAFAVIFDDPDAVPVCGFTWIHWIISDLKKTDLSENDSICDENLIQGRNSWCSCACNLSAEEATGYGGPDPPDRTHTYSLRVFALDKELGLPTGFTLNDLVNGMRGHVLAQAEIIGRYSPA